MQSIKNKSDLLEQHGGDTIVTTSASCILDLDLVESIVTWEQFKQLILTLPYGSPCRVMVLMLAYTGCRMKELDNMQTTGVTSNTIYWKTGKNQKGYRKETLPDSYIQELHYYRATQRTNSLNLFGVSSASFCRYFNKNRAVIGGAWNEKTTTQINNKPFTQYKLLLKHLRKTFQTICFKHYYEKYQSSYVAAEMVCKKLRHSNTGITIKHYIQNLERIDVEQWKRNFFSQKPNYEAQKKLLEY